MVCCKPDELNYRTIECDKCNKSHYIPVVQGEIVRKKQYIIKTYQKVHGTNEFPSNDKLKVAYKCPSSKCYGYLMPMSKIKHNNVSEIGVWNRCFVNSEYLIWEKCQTRRIIFRIICFIMFLLLVGPFIDFIDYSIIRPPIDRKINELIANHTDKDKLYIYHMHNTGWGLVSFIQLVPIVYLIGITQRFLTTKSNPLLDILSLMPGVIYFIVCTCLFTRAFQEVHSANHYLKHFPNTTNITLSPSQVDTLENFSDELKNNDGLVLTYGMMLWLIVISFITVISIVFGLLFGLIVCSYMCIKQYLFGNDKKPKTGRDYTEQLNVDMLPIVAENDNYMDVQHSGDAGYLEVEPINDTDV